MTVIVGHQRRKDYEVSQSFCTNGRFLSDQKTIDIVKSQKNYAFSYLSQIQIYVSMLR